MFKRKAEKLRNLEEEKKEQDDVISSLRGSGSRGMRPQPQHQN